MALRHAATALAAELVRLKVDVIVTLLNQETLAAKAGDLFAVSGEWEFHTYPVDSEHPHG